MTLALASAPDEAPPRGDAPRKSLFTVQILRGFAAIAVAIYHTHLILAKPQYGAIDVFGAVTSRGWVGVNFFFVLSGFIILFAHTRDIGQPAAAGRYIWRRFSRVYPIYWIFTALYVIAALLNLGSPEFRWTAENLISSATLIRFDPRPLAPLAVAWTLFYEVGFYAIFLTLILNRRFGVAVIAAWAVGIFVSSLVFGRTSPGILHMWNVYFLLGMGVYALFRRLQARWALPILIGGFVMLAAMLAAGMVHPRIGPAGRDTVELLLLALCFAAILLGAILYERDRVFTPPALLLLLGDASFSIYLVHSPVLSVAAAVNHKLFPGLLPPELVFIVTAIVAVAAGVLAYLLIERPLLAVLNRFGPRRRVAVQPAMAQ
ncbi:acyltransferase family protein [Sphingomonas sp. ID0503]|uniref:acyltransferase family protein n=1 Tax=Sphingomonas sp. ID0503 TaxID=3399691 RepID=UPI003AFB523F